MTAVWVTSGSPRPGPVVNSLNAACEQGFVPERVHVLSNPSVADDVPEIRALTEAIVTAYDAPAPTFETTDLDAETDFPGIVEHYREAITTAKEAGDEVAVDVTPGRKFMSAIAFQAGVQFEADHVFYLLVDSNRYYSLRYPEIPRTGVELIDFHAELVAE